jgi:hypothetical protein
LQPSGLEPVNGVLKFQVIELILVVEVLTFIKFLNLKFVILPEEMKGDIPCTVEYWDKLKSDSDDTQLLFKALR